MKKLKMAVIGTGMAWDRLHFPALQELQEQYEVVALANPTQEKLTEAGQKLALDTKHLYNDYHEMLKKEKIDVVNIAVPISMNYKVSLDVAKAGKNLICEKPLAATLEEAAKFIEIPQKYGVQVMIAENYRYNEEINMIKQLVEENKIGNVLYFIQHKTVNFPEEMKKDTFAAKEWRQYPDFPGGIFLDAAVHDMAAIRYIFGGIDKISAFGQPQEDQFSPYTSIHSQFLMRKESIGHFMHWMKGQESQKPAIGLRIFGTEGMIYLEDKNCGCINVFYNNGQHELISFTPERGYYNEFLNYYNAIVGKEKIQVPPMVGFGDTKTIFDILKSIKSQQIIQVESLDTYLTQESLESKKNRSKKPSSK